MNPDHTKNPPADVQHVIWRGLGIRGAGGQVVTDRASPADLAKAL